MPGIALQGMAVRGLPLAALAVLAACSGGGSSGGANGGGAAANPSGEVSYFRKEIVPVIQTQCATCHLTGEEAGKMSLVPDRAIASLVNVKANEAPKLVRVVPGDPDQSYLVMKLEGTHIQHGGNGARMPFGATPLPPETIAKFRTWIKDGAKP